MMRAEGYRSARRECGLLLAAALLALGSAEAQENRAPVLLRGGKLLTPAGTTCTGIAPELKLRVSLDARGRVTDVEVLDIQPTSDLDGVFRRAAVEKVRTWRYSPAFVDGAPVATDLEWSVQFVPKEGFVPNPDRRSTADTVFRAEDAAERRVDVSLLSPDEHRALLRCYTRVAEQYVDEATRQRFDSDRFVVISDSSHEGAAQSFANNLEASFNSLTEIFSPAMELQPSRLKLIAYVYQTRASLRRAVLDLGVAAPWDDGLYLPPGFLLFHLEVRSQEDLMHVLLHEVVHAYADRHLVHPGFAFPLWTEEGFAEYFANSRIKKGQLLPGKTLRRKLLLIPYWGAVVRPLTEQGWSAERVKRAITEDREIGVADLLAAEHRTFYGSRRSLFYPTAWLFVHFLRHGGDDEVADERFAALALYLAEGYTPREALETVYGRGLGELEKGFIRYVRRF